MASWRCAGVQVWPLLRTQLAYELDDYMAPVLRQRTGGRLQRWLGPRLSRERVALDELQLADVVCLSASTNRRFRVQGRHYCVFSDPLRESLAARGLACQILEFSPVGEARVPRASPAVSVQPWIDRAQSPGVRRQWIASARAWVGPASLRSCLERVAALTGQQVRARSLITEALKLRWLARRFERALRRIGARVAYVYGYYDFEAFALTFACRRLGIPVVDVQHGLQGVDHFAYARWADVPPEGYRLLPDVFWVWTGADADAIKTWAPSSCAVLQGGNQIVDAFLEDGHPLVHEHEGRLASRAAGAERRVLVALQRDVPGSYAELIRRSPPGWHWWVRPHPAVDPREALRELGALPHVEVELAASAPLYSLLRHSDALLSEGSSSCIEASWFGVPSVISDPRLLGSFAGLIDAGWATYAEDDGLLEALREVSPPGLPPRPHAGQRESLLSLAGAA